MTAPDIPGGGGEGGSTHNTTNRRYRAVWRIKYPCAKRIALVKLKKKKEKKVRRLDDEKGN